MKRSRAVQVFLLVSAAAAIESCGQKHEAVRRCVDEGGNLTDDRNCTVPAASSAHHYTWIYAPSGSGSKADGDAEPGKAGSTAGTERGVIGAEGAAHSAEAAGHGGGGEGGGE